MITEGKIADYIYARCKKFGIAEVYQWGNIPNGVVKKPRVTVQAKAQKEGKYWFDSFVEVNVCYPYLTENGVAPLNQIDNATIKANELFGKHVDRIDDDWIAFEIDSRNRIKDESLKCYYLNLHIRFKVLNINN